MNDYGKLTRAELIEKLQALERSTEGARAPEANPAVAAQSETAERLRAILETAVEAIITIDERGIIESLNPAAERTFGFKAEELVGKNVSMLMPSPYREEHDSYIARYLQSGKAKII